MSLEFKHIGHAYGKLQALDNINLTAGQGEITCLLGQSGCGKTTLLQLAAGLQPVQTGEILLNGKTLAKSGDNPPPENRPVGLVFQEGALFPHMNIAGNISFGLKDSDGPEAIVTKWLDQIGLSGLHDRYPHMLSGGQQQRVALARAMAPEPQVLLMDEPFANIDVVLRRSLRNETRRILKERGTTAVLVTHDPQEAMEIGDQIAIMDSGHIVQIGSPDDVYDRPETLSVGLMFGDGRAVDARKTDIGIETAFGTFPINCLANEWPGGENAVLLLRPASLTVEPNSDGIPIIDIRRVGRDQRLTLAAENGAILAADIAASRPFNIGDKLKVEAMGQNILAFPK